MLPDFIGGEIDIKYTVSQGKLWMSYLIGGEMSGRSYQSCIMGKGYPGLKLKGWIGVSSGNPQQQNINEIDVHSINVFN